MSLLGNIIKYSIGFGATPNRNPRPPIEYQREVLEKLLAKSQGTAFGKKYGFAKILASGSVIENFQKAVPTCHYESLFEEWWCRALADEPDVCWPGKVPYFGVSSGTSNAASKFIPVTEDMIRAIGVISRRMFFDLSKYDLPAGQFLKEMLMVGGSTQLHREGEHWWGDMSGIIGLNRPLWLQHYYRPGKHITNLDNWSARIERIADEAPSWKIGFAIGNTAWLQLMLEKIIERHGLRHIHEIWPDFRIFVHGGIFFEPYRSTFEPLLGKPMTYIDSYMASEGFIAYQNRPDTRNNKLILDGGIFFEFVPFNSTSFDEDGNLLPTSQALTVAEVQEDSDYALLMSTCSGAWRYLLGDTIRFTDLARTEIKVTGRTKHFLSVTGEHLSVDNMNAGIRWADEQLSAGVREFTVGGIPHGHYFAHKWYIGTDNAVNGEVFANLLDQHLCHINDDYRVERANPLRDVKVEVVPVQLFHRWFEMKGKMNGQAKFPRVLKDSQFIEWERFVESQMELPQ